MDAAALAQLLLPVVKPFAKQIWEGVIHPELLKLEGQIGSDQLKLIVASIDAALDNIVEAELK